MHFTKLLIIASTLFSTTFALPMQGHQGHHPYQQPVAVVPIPMKQAPFSALENVPPNTVVIKDINGRWHTLMPPTPVWPASPPPVVQLSNDQPVPHDEYPVGTAFIKSPQQHLWQHLTPLEAQANVLVRSALSTISSAPIPGRSMQAGTSARPS
jgi:hypothetical protein